MRLGTRQKVNAWGSGELDRGGEGVGLGGMLGHIRRQKVGFSDGGERPCHESVEAMGDD